MKKKRWTAKEIESLVKLWSNAPWEILHKEIPNRTEKAMQIKADQLDLRRNGKFKRIDKKQLKENVKKIEVIKDKTKTNYTIKDLKMELLKKIASLGGYSVFLIVQDGLTYYSYKGEYIVGKLIIGAGFNFKVDNEDIFIWNYNFYHDNRKFLFEIRKIQDLTTAIRKELYAFQYINPKAKGIIHRLKEIF